jgi:hypothetical protein
MQLLRDAVMRRFGDINKKHDTPKKKKKKNNDSDFSESEED